MWLRCWLVVVIDTSSLSVLGGSGSWAGLGIGRVWVLGGFDFVGWLHMWLTNFYLKDNLTKDQTITNGSDERTTQP